jgi:hypothetical protein
MEMPTHQNLRSNLDPKLQETEAATRLDNLRKSLQRAYKTVKENLQRSYQSNKNYYDRTAKERTFEEWDIIYLFNPTRKSQLSRKFRAVWTGPYRITRRAGPLNYQIENQEGKE